MTRQFASLSLVFALLAAASLALKNYAPATEEHATQPAITARLARSLAAQGFAVSIEPHRYQSPVVLGVRGACRVGARDASAGAALDVAFKQQFAGIGTLRYAYRGATYATLPRIRLFADRVVPRTLDRLGFRLLRPVPVAFARSTACATDLPRVPDIRVRS